MEKRRQHTNSAQAASDIADISDFLLSNVAFRARHRVFEIFKLCSLLINSPRSVLTFVTIDLGGIPLDADRFQDCLG